MTVTVSRRALLALGAIIGAAVLLFATSAVLASHDPNVTHACVAGNGSVRIVDSADDCRRGETDVSWNQQGPPGAAGDDGQDGDDGHSALVLVSPEGPGENCPAGGHQVRAGLDDGNGNFLHDESTTSYVCHGEDGADGQDGSDGQAGTDGVSGWERVHFTNETAVEVAPGGERSVTVTCPEGKRVLGGGGTTANPSFVLIRSYPPTDSAWTAHFRNVTNNTWEVRGAAWAICADVN